jgi:two-component system OmpR family response regulator
VVDDELVIRDSLKEWLQDEGFLVDMAESGPEALEKISKEAYHLMLLDIKMPGMDGVEVLKRAKAIRADLPAVMMTAYATPKLAVQAIKSGAADYLAKPFSFAELYARLRALTRRGSRERPVVLEVGDLTLDPAAHTVSRAGVPIEISPKEFALLEMFMRHAGEVVSRTQILEHVWDFAYDGTSNVVDVYVRYLREKIDRPFDRSSLETVRGVGYRLKDE